MRHFHNKLQADVLAASQLMRWDTLFSVVSGFQTALQPWWVQWRRCSTHVLILHPYGNHSVMLPYHEHLSAVKYVWYNARAVFLSLYFNVLRFTGKHSLWGKSIFNKDALGSCYFQYIKELCFKCECYSWWILCKLFLFNFCGKMMAFRWNINVKAFWKRIKTQFMKNKLRS